MNKSSENYVIKWLDRVEGYGTGLTGYIDENLPEVTWTVKKTDKNKQSKRFKYFQKLKEEIGCCELCGLKNGLVIDHCHTTRKIRGVLCHNCNHGLGKFKDDTKLLEKAIEYLKKDYSKSLDYYNLK